ncbi:alpha/beta hydrolase [Halorhabdus sp. CBA1104]|uniref:alpha/beta hydrolase n=1 Tax=Halorhabdus sp. CBA1104 TaxID=1380432 RepID=UPI0012B37C5A|nr:alpha/beta hydrolase [Halorhabdus sp. CBA1104]QGN06059.1 alpha/beta hydrolase [Halorhabdus sp. CBA1104]
MTARRWSRRTVLASVMATVAGCTGIERDGETATDPLPATTTDRPTRSDDEPPATTTADPADTERPETTSVDGDRQTNVPFRETPERTLELDLYEPPAGTDRPFVLFAHGGGWIGGDKGYRPMFDELVDAGFVVADVQYRLAQEKQYPAAVRDVVAALKWLRANADAHGIDPERGALSGYSAGAHLAALVAVAPAHERFQPADFHPDVPVAVDALVGYSGPYDFTDAGIGDNPLVAAFFGPEADVETLREGSPVTHVDSGDPPALLVHGTEDGVVPVRSTAVLADAYRDAGVTVEVITGEGADHGMIDSAEWREQTGAKQRQFLTAHLGGTRSER